MATLTVAEVLNRAAAYLDDAAAWTQGALGRDARGDEVMVENIGDAVCLCAAGAIWKFAGGYPGQDVVVKAFEAMQSRTAPNGVGVWNDAPERTQAEVVAALRAAALKAGAPA